MKILTQLALITIIFISQNHHVLSQVETQIGGVTIQSDNSDINFETGIRIYNGNVKIKHLNFYLEADTVEEYREGSKIMKLIAIGDPAKFWQTPPETINLKKGTAQYIEYFSETRVLNLTTYKTFDLSGNIMQGKHAAYHFK